jgi:hypothetical protein
MAKYKKLIEPEREQSFQRWEWRIQRLGWAAGISVILAALLGVFGSGYLSHVNAVSDDGRLSIEYQRVLRRRQGSEFRVKFSGQSSRDPIRLWISQPFFATLEIHRIVPEPLKSFTQTDGTTFEFPLVAGSDSGEIVLHIEPDQLGSFSAEIRTGEVGIPIDCYVLP